MRGNELLDILEYIEPKLIIDADRKLRFPWKIWVKRAVCLLLVAFLSIELILAYYPLRGKAPKFNSLASPDRLSGVCLSGDVIDLYNYGAGCANPYRIFRTQLVVEARMSELLPDTYFDLINRYEYRIARMELLDVVNGKSMPQQFFLRLKADLFWELDRYDSLVLSLQQKGIENYLLLNRDANTLAPFPNMFEVTDNCSAIAFNDGVVDQTLWDQEGWDINSAARIRIREGKTPNYDRSGYFPTTAGWDAARTKEFIFQEVRESATLDVLDYIDSSYFENQELISKVISFEEGTFAQELEYFHDYKTGGYTQYLRCVRIINGFATTEEHYVKKTETHAYNPAFTQNELESIVNLGALIEDLNLNRLRMPHVLPLTPVQVTGRGVSGKYFKYENMVFGVVKVSWKFHVPLSTRVYYDAMFILVAPDGTYHPVDRERIENMIGANDNFVRDVKYGIF